jgi:hypothetical protein
LFKAPIAALDLWVAGGQDGPAGKNRERAQPGADDEAWIVLGRRTKSRLASSGRRIGDLLKFVTK